MKNKITLLLLAAVVALTGCLETTEEITINKDGSGTLVTTNDMSAMIALAKMAGENKEMEELKEKKIDTTFSLGAVANSMQGLSAEEKAMLKNGTMNMVMNMQDEKMIMKSTVPFKKIDQLARVSGISTRMVEESFKKGMGEKEKEGEQKEDDKMPGLPLDEYYTTTYSASVIERKLNKEKHANLSEDEGAQAMKQMGDMGMTAKKTIVINLPRPAKKAEGKNVQLSEDKMKVTITGNSEIFFDDATALEFRIEY